jgi:MoaA/NifB/PqqE/SkfB family radical SAM enzyme
MASMGGRARVVTRLARARARGRPHTLSHLATARCNGRCPTCLWRADARLSEGRASGGAAGTPARRDELNARNIAWLYRESGRAGFAQVVVWGGEPLLRDDLPELLGSARNAGLLTTVITNGWLASERWPTLRGLIDVLILSLDDVGAAHDELRGLPGLYARLETFVADLQRDTRRPQLLVNMVLSRANAGALRRVAEVARRWQAGLYFCPMATGQLLSTGLVEPLVDQALPPHGLRAAALEAQALKSAGYPVLSTRAYLDFLARDPGLHGYRCRGPHSILTVTAEGEIADCRRQDVAFADVGELIASGSSLASVLALPRRRQLLDEAARCSLCNNPDVIELSWLWDLRPAMLRKVAELAIRSGRTA